MPSSRTFVTDPASAPRPWLRIGVGLIWLIVAAWIWATRAGVLLAGHPAYAVLVSAAALIGLVLVVLAVRATPGRGSTGRRWLRITGRVIGVLATIVVVGALIWLRPLPAAPTALEAMDGSDSVQVTTSATRITLTPRNSTASTTAAGLIFQPGAKVDPRAYVPLLTRLADAGYLVAIIKQPLNIGFASIGAPGAVIEDHPEVQSWAVGRHSLGGVAASSYAADHPDQIGGLLLWASYPLGSLADRDGLQVSSVSGTEDGLATPADIEESRVDLPASTDFVAVEGAVHAFFGDYGAQAGDGTPRTRRSQAQLEIVEASSRLLDAVAVDNVGGG